MIDDTEQFATASAPEPETRARADLTPEARRALAEAAERRKSAEAAASATRAAEVGGRTGPDPVRYGDWETGGIVSDF